MTGRLRRSLLGAATALGAGACGPPIEESTVETIRRPPAERLVIRLDEGSLSVAASESAGISIEIRRTARALSRETARSMLGAITMEAVLIEEGEVLEVTSRRTGAAGWRPSEELRLDVAIGVPPGTAVEARTGSGQLRFRGLDGPVVGVTAEGRIVAEEVRSPETGDGAAIRLRSGEGRIEGRRLEGRVHAETAEGRIRLEGWLAEVTAVAGDGSIEVGVHAGGPSVTGNWLLESADGRVQLTLPAGANALLSVFGDLAPDDQEDELRWEVLGPLARARLGGGSGARIHLHAAHGSAGVRLRRPE